MTQGDPLGIVSYVIGVLMMIKIMKAAYHDVTQSCYTYNSDALGTFYNIGLYFNLLKHFGPGNGYYPKPLKIIIIVHPDNLT